MAIFSTLIQVVQIISALAVIGLVLMQHGKGADMGAAFGSGASGSVFGATGSANFLSRATAVAAGVFFVSTLMLAFVINGKARPGNSVMNDATISAPAVPVDAVKPPVAPSDAVPATPAKPSVPATPAAAPAVVPAAAPAVTAPAVKPNQVPQ
jgi:preprotein translocase subunit SecG